MKVAVIYARYSSDNQTEQSIEGQLRVCEQYAQNHGYAILEKYIDRAMTGTNDNRPDFQRMIKDSAKREFEYIIVYKIDRFSRNKYEIAKNKKILKDNGVKLLSAMENIPDTPEGIILESLLEGMAEYYSAELSQKVKRGMNETRLKGNFTGGKVIYGYKVENHKIVVDEEQAEVVRYIFKQYLLGEYVKDIIASLTSRGILRNGRPFIEKTIYGMLNNEKYIGIFWHENQVFDNMYPKIISVDMFNAIQNKSRKNRYGKRSTKVIYLLRSKLICGYCGKSMNAESATSKTGRTNRYYNCLGRKKGTGCKQPIVRKDVLEKFVLDNVIKILRKPQIMDCVVKNIMDEQKNQENNLSIIESLMKNKNKAEIALQNLIRALEQGIVNNSTNQRIKELETTITEIDKQILIEKSKTPTEVSEEEVRKFYKEALLFDSLKLISYVIKYIKVFEDKIEITFNNPIKISPDDDQGFFIYSYIANFPKYIQNKEYLISVEIKLYV